MRSSIGSRILRIALSVSPGIGKESTPMKISWVDSERGLPWVRDRCPAGRPVRPPKARDGRRPGRDAADRPRRGKPGCTQNPARPGRGPRQTFPNAGWKGIVTGNPPNAPRPSCRRSGSRRPGGRTASPRSPSPPGRAPRAFSSPWAVPRTPARRGPAGSSGS